MEKQPNHKVAVRIKPCRQKLLHVSEGNQQKKEIRIVNRELSESRKFHLQHVYGRDHSNLDIFCDIFGKDQKIIEIKDTFVVLMGSRNSGKFHTLQANMRGKIIYDELEQEAEEYQEQQLGILYHLARSINQQTCDSATVQAQYRFLQALEEDVQNIGSSLHFNAEGSQGVSEQLYAVNIYDEDELADMLIRVNEQRRVGMHFIVETTFVELSSEVFDEKSPLCSSAKREAQCLLRILQNLGRIRNMNAQKQRTWFEEERLTQILKRNLLAAQSWYVVGLIDESLYASSIQTLKYLETVSEIKSDKTVIEAMKAQIQREEGLLKRVCDKHKRVLTLLGKCVDIQPSFLDRKSAAYSDSLALSQKRANKMKIATAKKIQNQQHIEQLLNNIAQEEQQIRKIREQHESKLSELTKMKQSMIEQQNEILKRMEELGEPPYKHDELPNGVYWKPNPSGDKRDAYESKSSETETIPSYSRQQPNQAQSIGAFSLSKKAFSPSTGADLKQDNGEVIRTKKKVIISQDKYSRQDEEFTRIISARKEQLKIQIGSLFSLVELQQRTIEQRSEEFGPIFGNFLPNKIKSRKNTLEVDHQVLACSLRAYKLKEGEGRYQMILQDEQVWQQHLQQQFKSPLLTTTTAIKE